jgi:hypothetical protein
MAESFYPESIMPNIPAATAMIAIKDASAQKTPGSESSHANSRSNSHFPV